MTPESGLGCTDPMGRAPGSLRSSSGSEVLSRHLPTRLYDECKHTGSYSEPAWLKRMVASGRLGRKSGRGFYR